LNSSVFFTSFLLTPASLLRNMLNVPGAS